MTFDIRRATPEDAPAIRRVARESWHAAYDDVLDPESVDSVVDDWYDLDGLSASVAREDGRFLVAEAAESDETDREDGESDGRDGKFDGGDGKFDGGDGEPDREVVGFAQTVLGGDDGDDAANLPRVYAHPDYWGTGVGSALLDRIETWLRERGVERLRLLVLADNEVGNAFYEKRGFRIVASRESEIDGETYAEYVREKEL